MRPTACKIMLAAVAACCLAQPAPAGARVVTRTVTYPIAGVTARALVDSMDRNGPKHGFMTRAIALTGYTVDWQLRTRRDGNVCRMLDAAGTLNLTYTFPRVVSPMARPLAARWKRFFAGVRRHERMHGRIANDMVAAASTAARAVVLADDPSCARTRREAKRRIDAVYAEYEARQVAFDAREHRRGGPVERLVAAFMRER